MDIKKYEQLANSKKQAVKLLIKKLKKKKGKEIDGLFHKYHDKIFEEINCLDCANCCKQISPMIFNKDIDRLSKHLRIKPSKLASKYLTTDNNNDDYVFNVNPCPFLDENNYCKVYDARPKACKEIFQRKTPKTCKEKKQRKEADKRKIFIFLSWMIKSL